MTLASLSSLASKFGSDKGRRGPTSEWGGHNYTDIYEVLFRPLRDKHVYLLEIGIGLASEIADTDIVVGRNAEGAASLRMWNDYFLRGMIFGVDRSQFSATISNRVRTGVADQRNCEQLRSQVEAFKVSSFDVVIDDGSHRASDQQTTLEMLFDYLEPGGIYVIEDLNNQRDVTVQGKPVDCTRSVLKGFCERKSFGEPNAFKAPSKLAEQISDVALLSPARQTTLKDFISTQLRRYGLRNPRQEKRERFFTDTEKLAILWKKFD